MTLAELISAVYDITKRPDRVQETNSAIKSATLKAHQFDFLVRDIFETGINFGTPNYVNNLDYKTVIPRFRVPKYLRKYDYTNSAPGDFLTKLTPEQILDRYNTQKQDVYYVAGQYIQINSSTQDQYYLFGCYIDPDISDASFTSWIANDFPYCIVYYAAAIVEIGLGKLDEAKLHQALGEDEKSRIVIQDISLRTSV